jgi:FkbM family methyltransferase
MSTKQIKIQLKNKETLNIKLDAGDCVIDCGANIGNFTELFQSMGGNVIAFEPNVYAFEILKKRFYNNNRVKCIQKGVSGIKSAGPKKMFLHEKAEENQVVYSTGSSILESKININKDNFINIELIDLCHFLIDFKKRVNKEIKILKIDIEGAEIELLNDLMDQDLIRDIPYVFVETHENKIPELKHSTQKLKERIEKENYVNINLNWI